ncbi:MAG: ABC transporter permease [Oligoflexia bacterium]|nr:ABC transporter permease [Oligoflexia bacterium]
MILRNIHLYFHNLYHLIFHNVIFKMATRNLKRNKRRSTAVILTIGLGVGALFLYHGFNNGILNQYKFTTIRSRYGHGQINTKDYLDKVYEKPWEHWINNVDEVEKALKNDPRILYYFPRVDFYTMVTNGKINVAAKGQGVIGENESRFFTALNIVSGKNLSDEPDGILLGSGLARSLDLKIGSRVTVLTNTVFGSLNGLDFNVIGIFYTGTKEFDDTFFRIPLKQAHLILDTNKIESIALGLKEDDDWEEVSRDIVTKFPNLGTTPFAVLDKVYYQNGVDFLMAQFGVIRIIILVIVILGIFNTVSTSILERKQEIGNLRANGESKTDIMYLLLTEGLVVGIISGIIGLTAAIIINNLVLFKGITMPACPGLTRNFLVFLELQPIHALETFSLGLFSALVGTYFAARKINKKSISELLRSV